MTRRIPFLSLPDDDPAAHPDRAIIRAGSQVERPRSYIGIEADRIALTKSGPPDGVYFQDIEYGGLSQWVRDHWEDIGPTYLQGGSALSDIAVAKRQSPRPYHQATGGSVVAVGGPVGSGNPINDPVAGPYGLSRQGWPGGFDIFSNPLPAATHIAPGPTVTLSSGVVNFPTPVPTSGIVAIGISGLITVHDLTEVLVIEVFADATLLAQSNYSGDGAPGGLYTNDFGAVAAAACIPGATVSIKARIDGVTLEADVWFWGLEVYVTNALA